MNSLEEIMKKYQQELKVYDERIKALNNEISSKDQINAELTNVRNYKILSQILAN